MVLLQPKLKLSKPKKDQMKSDARMVEVLRLKPHKVVFRFCDSGKICTLSRNGFEKRIDLGLYEVSNPKKLFQVF